MRSPQLIQEVIDIGGADVEVEEYRENASAPVFGGWITIFIFARLWIKTVIGQVVEKAVTGALILGSVASVYAPVRHSSRYCTQVPVVGQFEISSVKLPQSHTPRWGWLLSEHRAIQRSGFSLQPAEQQAQKQQWSNQLDQVAKRSDSPLKGPAPPYAWL
jgi:hypothetical protein